jgi:hypothetical protein
LLLKSGIMNGWSVSKKKEFVHLVTEVAEVSDLTICRIICCCSNAAKGM